MMLETNKNYFADNRDILKTIPDKSINMFLEDMPYNTTQCDWEYEVDLKEYWDLRLPKLSDNGIFVLTGKQPFTSKLILSNEKMFKYELIWNKHRTSASQLANIRPLPSHENVLIFYKKNKYFPQMTKGRYMKKAAGGKSDNYGEIKIVRYGSDLYYPRSILDFKACHNMTGKIHPTEKPSELFEYLIKTYTNENDIVFDGYSGSGTTAIACIRNNRKYIICENKKEYFDLQTKRIQEEIDKTSLFNSLGGRQDKLSA